MYGYMANGLEDLDFEVLLHFCVLFRAAVVTITPVGLLLDGRVCGTNIVLLCALLF